MSRIDEKLTRLIRDVRRRYRMKLLLRGLSYTAAVALALFVVLSFVAAQSGFAPAVTVGLRLVGWVAVLFIVARWLVLPQFRRPSDAQVALYVEEHVPALDSSLLSAIDEHDNASPALLRRTVEDALARMRTADDGRTIEKRDVVFSSAVLGVVVASVLVLVAARPATLRHGAGALLNPLASVAGAEPFTIAVEPGDVTIPRGADATVRAVLRGFHATGADVLVRTGADSLFARVPMIAPGTDSSTFEVMLFTLRDDAEYFVEAGDVRSRVHRITVADLPYVERLALEYRFPAYTGLPPQVVEDGGDVAALRGTTVVVSATPTVPVRGARIVIEDGATRPLSVNPDGSLTGEFTIERAGFYHIELDAGSGMVNGSPQYTIDVLDDGAPTVRFTEPGRDTRPTSVDEVRLEAQADDDYGVARIELVYSVNGGDEQTVPIYSGRALPQVSGGHTLYLEEMALEAGDLIAYYARATDNSAATPHTVTSDMYFLSIRPFGRDYRQAEQAGAPGGGGSEENGDLAQTQREIIAATFNVVRARERISAEELAENLNTIALAQERLRGQVETLAQRMRARGVTEDTVFRRIAAILPQAAEEMTAAVERLRARAPDDALPSEQRALQHLQRAEALYRDVQVSMQQQGGGSGGGGAPNAEDLADLLELELDQLRNQYETVQQGQREEAQQGVDETLERLRELARRQEQELERQRRAASQQGASSGSSAAAQRQLAEETEQAARQLERLARETNRDDLGETARRMQDAANAMRRAAADQRSGSTAQGQQALEQLRDARRRLERDRQNALEEEAGQLRREVERMAQEQERITEGMQRLQEQTGAERAAGARELIERKTELAQDVAEMERTLQRMANEARGGQNDASRQLRAAADAIRDGELREMIEWSRNLTQPNAPRELIDQIEERITDGIAGVGERMADARIALGERAGEDRAAETVEQARDLARGVESLAEQARRQAEQRRGQAEQGTQRGQPAGATNGTPSGGGDPGRQLRNALEQRIADAEALRQELLRQGVDADRLEDVLSAMRALGRADALSDPAALARLQTEVVDGAKEVEFALRRALLAENENAPRLSATADVAEEFRRLVEEYYRALARQR